MTMQRRLLTIGGIILVIAIAAGAWYLTRPAPAEVDITSALGSESPTDTASPAASTPAPAPSTSTVAPSGEVSGDASSAPADGTTWTVSTDAVAYDFDGPSGTFAGFRIDEELSSVGSTTAVARTPEVTGSLTLADTTISEAEFTADLTAITSNRAQRNGAIQRALNTSTNPDATFTLTEPIDLDEVPPVGEVIEAQGTGDLTINGVTTTTTIPLQAALRDDGLLVVTSSFEVSLSDYDVQQPSAPIVVSVADTATVELQLYFES